LNCQSILFLRFEFGPDNIIIRGSNDPSRPNNPKFNLVVYFDLNYAACYNFVFQTILIFFTSSVSYSEVVLKSIVPPPFQITCHSGFARFILFVMYLDIIYI
jgi:hypothetical protein